MAFRLENNQSRKIPYLMEFDETQRFWYPRVARDAWINFSSRTVEFRLSKSRENPHFLSLSFFLFLLPCLFFFSSPRFPSFPSLSHRILTFYMFVPLSFSFPHFQSGTARNQSKKFPIFSPKILGLNHATSYGSKEHLCH